MGLQIQQRYVLTGMLFIAVTIGLAERGVLSMAITRMVNSPDHRKDDVPVTEQICTAPQWAVNETGGVIIDESQNGAKYDWTQEQQGIVLSAFYVGYIFTHIPGGLLAQNFGGKYVFSLTVIIPAMLSMITPIAVAYGGLYALIAIRILMGAFQGPLFPAMIQMLAMWTPPAERAFSTSFVYSGTAIGAVISTYFSGIILHYFRWESVFYVFGFAAIVWFILFVFICYNSPAAHPFISTAEKEYLLKELGQLERAKNQSPTPWSKIFTSEAIWALIMAKICADWSYYVASVTLPKYMNDVLKLSIRDIGAYNSLPWIMKTLLSYAFGFAIDKAIANDNISVTNARKFAVFLSSVLPAIFIMLASYAECAHLLVVIFFTISIGSYAFQTSGLNINPMDLSANYSGTLMSLANGAASITGILAPYTVGLLTPNSYLSEWRLVFWITFVVHILKTMIFTIWGSGKTQSWNASTTDVEKIIETKSKTKYTFE